MIEPILKPKDKEGKVELSAYQLQKERKRRWDTGERTCHLCNRQVFWFEDYVLDHIEPASGVGSKRDSSEANLDPAHVLCNLVKGSRHVDSRCKCGAAILRGGRLCMRGHDGAA